MYWWSAKICHTIFKLGSLIDYYNFYFRRKLQIYYIYSRLFYTIMVRCTLSTLIINNIIRRTMVRERYFVWYLKHAHFLFFYIIFSYIIIFLRLICIYIFEHLRLAVVAYITLYPRAFDIYRITWHLERATSSPLSFKNMENRFVFLCHTDKEKAKEIRQKSILKLNKKRRKTTKIIIPE